MPRISSRSRIACACPRSEPGRTAPPSTAVLRSAEKTPFVEAPAAADAWRRAPAPRGAGGAERPLRPTTAGPRVARFPGARGPVEAPAAADAWRRARAPRGAGGAERPLRSTIDDPRVARFPGVRGPGKRRAIRRSGLLPGPGRLLVVAFARGLDLLLVLAEDLGD